jgi:L-fuculose-phosphate aldolase
MLSHQYSINPLTLSVYSDVNISHLHLHGLHCDDKRAILLAHHGQLVATETIEEAAVLAVFIERAARMQVLAESIGTIKHIDPAMAREAHDYRLKSRAVAATFHYYARRVLKHENDVLD